MVPAWFLNIIYVNTINNMFKPGDRIRGIEMNSMLKEEDEDGTQVVGRFDKIKVDYDNQQIRAFIKDPSTMKTTEVYPGTMERIMESSTSQIMKQPSIDNPNGIVDVNDFEGDLQEF